MDFGDLSENRLIAELTKKHGTWRPLFEEGSEFVTEFVTVEWDKVLEEFVDATGRDKITASEIIVDFMRLSGDSVSC